MLSGRRLQCLRKNRQSSDNSLVQKKRTLQSLSQIPSSWCKWPFCCFQVFSLFVPGQTGMWFHKKFSFALNSPNCCWVRMKQRTNHCLDFYSIQNSWELVSLSVIQINLLTMGERGGEYPQISWRYSILEVWIVFSLSLLSLLTVMFTSVYTFIIFKGL